MDREAEARKHRPKGPHGSKEAEPWKNILPCIISTLGWFQKKWSIFPRQTSPQTLVYIPERDPSILRYLEIPFNADSRRNFQCH